MKADIDLTKMPEGGRYEDRYGHYLSIFQRVAESSVELVVKNAPFSWIPLLTYLGAKCNGGQSYFKHCGLVSRIMFPCDRLALEATTVYRPECVDALWKADMQWDVRNMNDFSPEQEFIVSNNGSFHRREVRDYFDRLEAYTPTKKKVVLVPCAADKPYPAKMHQAVLDMLPDDYYLANLTGVLGIVPQDLWEGMPYYDSGIPNEWRLAHILKGYFLRHEHERIVIYADYYNLAADQAITNAGMGDKTTFVNEVKFYYDYLDLLDNQRLSKLKEALI